MRLVATSMAMSERKTGEPDSPQERLLRSLWRMLLGCLGRSLESRNRVAEDKGFAPNEDKVVCPGTGQIHTKPVFMGFVWIFLV